MSFADKETDSDQPKKRDSGTMGWWPGDPRLASRKPAEPRGNDSRRVLARTPPSVCALPGLRTEHAVCVHTAACTGQTGLCRLRIPAATATARISKNLPEAILSKRYPSVHPQEARSACTVSLPVRWLCLPPAAAGSPEGKPVVRRPGAENGQTQSEAMTAALLHLGSL